MKNLALLTITYSTLLFCAQSAIAATTLKERVVFSFPGAPGGSVPAGGAVFDDQGNLYVVSVGAGSQSCVPIANECGAVYKLSPPAKKGDPWTGVLVRLFKGKEANDPSLPTSGVIIDSFGNLYGVSGFGGSGNCVLKGIPVGCGTVYELSPPKHQGGDWMEAVLYSFPTSRQGYLPWGNLVFDSAGNLYGATQFGGGRGTI